MTTHTTDQTLPTTVLETEVLALATIQQALAAGDVKRASFHAAGSFAFAACELLPDGVPPEVTYPEVVTPRDPAAVIARVHQLLAHARTQSDHLKVTLRLDRCRLLIDDAAESLGLPVPDAGAGAQ